jgi:hypothetical protein
MELCLVCNENEALNGFECFGCHIDKFYSEVIDSDLTLDWKD